jgi:putative GTP pyrophosphokinase
MLRKAVVAPNLWGACDMMMLNERLTRMEADEMTRFIAEYAAYVQEILEPTEREAKALFKSWHQADYWRKYSRSTPSAVPSPIQRVRTRIKRPEAVVDKILRKRDGFPGGLSIASVRSMPDTMGARIIVYFLSQFETIDREIRNHPLLEISTTDPPVAYLSEDLLRRCHLSHLEQRRDKESGYASIHYIIRLKDSAVENGVRPWFELQLRTLSEDVWGEIEHLLGYKPDKRTSLSVRRQFRILSSVLTAVDEHFNLLYDELAKFQGLVQFEDDHSLNAENLPAVLEAHELSCAQKEIDGMLKLLASRGIERVGDFRAVATGRNLDLIQSTYIESEGRSPGNYEVVASLATLRDLTNEAQIRATVRAHIEYLKAWEELKRPRRSRDTPPK